MNAPLHTPIITRWEKCYDESWKGVIVDDAFAHPAKIAPALARRIYAHAFAEGWVKSGDSVVDPFGGIGGTALYAAVNGLAWRGCELEPKFHALALQNFDLWERRFGLTENWCRPEMANGDSRKLCSVFAEAWLVVSSPPFSHPNEQPVASQSRLLSKGYDALKSPEKMSCGQSAGNLESMPAGEAPVLVVSSPPYVSGGHHSDQTGAWGGKAQALTKEQAGYGGEAGQLGRMREGQTPAIVVSSPPYAGIAAGAGGLNHKPGAAGQQTGRSGDTASQAADQRYGDTPGQLAVMPECGAETFWSAAGEIVAQCHQILRPGGVAIWVTKDYVRKGKRVPFGDQWQALCEQHGFRLLCRHHAMLVELGGEQGGLFGEATELKRERKSFFRRIAEAKGSPSIDWEDVLCLQKV